MKQVSYDEYLKIKESGLEGGQLLAALTEFELKNPLNFESKVDLGNYYLLINNYEKAEEYLRRAESVIHYAVNGPEKPKTVAILYGSVAHVLYNKGNYNEALSYVDRALADGSGTYGYLKGHILQARGDKEGAVDQFRAVYEAFPDAISPEDITALVNLYAENAAYAEALPFLDIYFVRGSYYPGFGIFASNIYEGAGDYGKSIVCAYLDLEYYRSKLGIGDDQVAQNLLALESALREKGRLEDAGDDFNLVRSLASAGRYEEQERDTFMPRDYLVLQQKIIGGGARTQDIQAYLNYENFFKNSPVYYITAWKAFTDSPSSQKAAYTVILEKVLALKPEKSIDRKVRTWIGEGLGFGVRDAENLLMPFEVAEILDGYMVSRDKAALERVYALFELPDNIYVLNALALVKSRRDGLTLRPVFEERLVNASAKLKERINFILQ
ncbi:MAG: tetratricopeptide repeat protein [Treponema sp.]|nr:tetratricopeptide repeat protein [Treponema sp.]